VTVAAIILAAILAAAAVLLVARPFLRSPQPGATGAPADDEALDRARRLDERDRALAALKELEFDHRTGKISDADYRELVGALRQEAAAAIRALEPEGGRRTAVDEPAPQRQEPPVEREPVANREDTPR
jgi:hypothetical protein